MDAWCRDVAPSGDLRRWFNHDPAKWKEFQRRYRAELADNHTACQPLLDAANQSLQLRHKLRGFFVHLTWVWSRHTVSQPA